MGREEKYFSFLLIYLFLEPLSISKTKKKATKKPQHHTYTHTRKLKKKKKYNKKSMFSGLLFSLPLIPTY